MTRDAVVGLGALGLAALALAAPAYAWRSPSTGERLALVAAIRKNPAAHGVSSIQRLRISTVDRRFGSAVTFPRDAAGHVIGRDSWLLHHSAQGWRVAFVGSDMPRCQVAPAAVRRDLLGSAVCFNP